MTRMLPQWPASSRYLRPRARCLVIGLMAVGGLAAGGLAATPAAMAQAVAVTQTFSYQTGSPAPVQQFTVPAGNAQVTITAEGGTGWSASYGGGAGGEGAAVTATVPVTAGETLNVVVGGDAGADGNTCDAYGAYGACGGPGAGAGGSSPSYGGGGGGGGSEVSDSSGNPLVVAGGGGGGGDSNNVSTSGGAPGCQTSGGAGGAWRRRRHGRQPGTGLPRFRGHRRRWRRRSCRDRHGRRDRRGWRHRRRLLLQLQRRAREHCHRTSRR